MRSAMFIIQELILDMLNDVCNAGKLSVKQLAAQTAVFQIQCLYIVVSTYVTDNMDKIR